MSEPCTRPDCDVYPYYGLAPHNPDNHAEIRPRDQWPDNFVLDDEDDDPAARPSYPTACGTYYCPSCRAGHPLPR